MAYKIKSYVVFIQESNIIRTKIQKKNNNGTKSDNFIYSITDFIINIHNASTPKIPILQ